MKKQQLKLTSGNKQSNNTIKMLDADIINKVEQFKDYGSAIASLFQERDTVVESLMVASVMGEHVLLIGEPGTTKSMIAKTFLRNFVGIDHIKEVFQTQFSAGTTEESVFGPINVKKLREEGVMEHNVEGMLPTAKVAFMDEIMDASDVILRSLLEILNERRYSKPPQNFDTPLHMAVCTSNYMKVSDNMDAVLDRILFKVNVQYIQDNANRLEFYRAQAVPRKVKSGALLLKKEEKYDFNCLLELNKALDLIEIPDDVLVKYDELQKELHAQLKLKKPFSDRRLGKLIKVIKVSALFDNRAVAKFEDLDMLKHGLINPGISEDLAVFNAVYEKVVLNPMKEKLLEDVLNDFQHKLAQYQSMEFDADERANNQLRLKRVNELKAEFDNRLEGFQGSPNKEVEERVRSTRDLFIQAVRSLHKRLGLPVEVPTVKEVAAKSK